MRATETERACANASRSITVGTMVLSSFMADRLLPGRKTCPRVVPLPRNSSRHSAAGHQRSIRLAVGPPDAETWCARPDQKYECRALADLLNGNGQRSGKTLNGNDLIAPQGHLMTLRRDEIVAIESLPTSLPISVQEV